jgi:hypothetical protein
MLLSAVAFEQILGGAYLPLGHNLAQLVNGNCLFVGEGKREGKEKKIYVILF